MQATGVLVVREQPGEFIAKDRAATWLEYNHRHAGADFIAYATQDLLQPLLRGVEHSVIVKRTATTEIFLRNDHLETGVFEHLDSGTGNLWMEKIVEGVGKQEHGRAAFVDDAAFFEPVLEGFGCEGGQAPLGRSADQKFHHGGK